MISTPVEDIREIAFFMQQLSYAAIALEKRYKFIPGSGKDRGFDWEFGTEVFRSNIRNKSFDSIPFLSHVESSCRIKGSIELAANMLKIVNRYAFDEFNGVDLESVWEIISKAGQGSICDLYFRCGEGPGLSPKTAPNFALSVDKAAPSEVTELVKWLGFDENLRMELQGTCDRDLMFLKLKEGRVFSLGGVDKFDRLPRAIEVINSQVASGDVAYFSSSLRVGACGYPLAARPTEELVEIDKRQRKRADSLLEIIAELFPDVEWKFWISAVSGDAIFGFDWDRTGSVVENYSFERQVAALKTKGISHSFILSWNGERYRLEIKGLDIQSDLGRLFGSFGLKFED